MTSNETQVRQWLSEAPDFDSINITATVHVELQPTEAVALALHAKQAGTTIEHALGRLIQAMLDENNGIRIGDLIHEAPEHPAHDDQEDAA